MSRVATVMRDLAAVAATDPEEARRVLADVVESVVLRLAPEGYLPEVTVRNETAAIAGRRVLETASCGGLLSGTCASLDIPKVDLYARGPRYGLGPVRAS